MRRCQRLYFVCCRRSLLFKAIETMKSITWHVIGGLLFLMSGEVFALNNDLTPIPPMGWISRQRFGCNIDCHAYPDDCIR